MMQILECPSRKLELTGIKARQRAMWASGDFAVIGTTLQLVGESLCEAADLRAGSKVLDVACGNGNATLAAARHFCDVTGVDYVPALLSRTAARARAERLAVQLVEGDAECLPFVDASFDLALSTFGVMFAPDQRQAARELTRVVRRGGRIALASWTPEGFLGDLLRTVGRYTPPPQGVASPLRWGTASGIEELFGGAVSVVQAQPKHFVFRYRSAQHFLDVFREFYGPTHKAFEALDEVQKDGLANDILQLLATRDRGAGGALAVPAQYLEVVLEV